MAEKGRKLYERLPWETPREFGAFRLYRDLGTERSAAQTVLAARREKMRGCGRETVDRLSAANAWRARAAAWDDEQDRKRREASLKRVAEMAERHVQISLLMLSKSVAAMQGMNASDLSPSEAAKLTELGVRIEREARGMSGARVAVEHSGAVAVETGEVARRILASAGAREKALELLDELYAEEGAEAGSASAHEG